MSSILQQWKWCGAMEDLTGLGDGAGGKRDSSSLGPSTGSRWWRRTGLLTRVSFALGLIPSFYSFLDFIFSSLFYFVSLFYPILPLISSLHFLVRFLLRAGTDAGSSDGGLAARQGSSLGLAQCGWARGGGWASRRSTGWRLGRSMMASAVWGEHGDAGSRGRHRWVPKGLGVGEDSDDTFARARRWI